MFAQRFVYVNEENVVYKQFAELKPMRNSRENGFIQQNSIYCMMLLSSNRVTCMLSTKYYMCRYYYGLSAVL